MATKKSTKSKVNKKPKKSIKKKKSVSKKTSQVKTRAKKSPSAGKKKTAKQSRYTVDTVFIVNPNAGAGKAQKRWPEIENLVLKNIDDYQVLFTESRGHATRLARKAIREGCRNIVAIGGDGTISEVAAGFFDEKSRLIQKVSEHSTRLGIIAAGRGSDLVRTLEIPRDVDKAIQVLKQGNERIIDMGLVTFQNRQGEKETRPFINISDVGIGGEVIEILEKQGKSKGGFLSYQLASLKGLMRYQNKKMYITIDDRIKREGIFNAVIVANGRYFGSGMMIAPHADPGDGFFDVVLMGEIKKLEMILKMPRLQKGTHIYEDGIEVVRAKKVHVETDARALLDLDGEGPGMTPVDFEMVSSAIKVIVP